MSESGDKGYDLFPMVADFHRYFDDVGDVSGFDGSSVDDLDGAWDFEFLEGELVLSCEDLVDEGEASGAGVAQGVLRVFRFPRMAGTTIRFWSSFRSSSGDRARAEIFRVAEKSEDDYFHDHVTSESG